MTRRLREGLLWTGAALGLFAVVAGVAVALFGFSFLIFRSGSMGPDIPTGSLALAHEVPAADLHPGDVVSVVAANGERVTHRIVSTTLRGDEASLVLKGDANGSPDDEVYVVTSAEREIVSVPGAGYAASYLLSPAGLVVAGCLAGMSLILGFGHRDDEPPMSGGPGGPGGRHRRDEAPRGRRRLAGAAASVAVVAASAALTGVTGTGAYFIDTATAASGTFSAATVPTPVLTCTGNGGTTLTITWPTVSLPGATITYAATLSTGATLTVTGTGTSRSTTVDTAQAPGALLSSVNYTVSVVARTGGTPAWTATATQPISTYGAIVMNMQCNAR